MKVNYIIFCLLNIILFKHFSYGASSFVSERLSRPALSQNSSHQRLYRQLVVLPRLEKLTPSILPPSLERRRGYSESSASPSPISSSRSPQSVILPSFEGPALLTPLSASISSRRKIIPSVIRAFLPWHQELVNRAIEFLRGGNQTPTAIQELDIYQQKFLDKYFPGKRCDFIISWRDELTTQGSPAELFVMLIKYSLKNPSYLGNQSLVNTILKKAADLGNIKAKYELAKNYYKDSKVQIRLGISLKDSAKHLLEGIVCSTYHPSALKLYAKILNQIVVKIVESPSPSTKGVRIIRLKEDQ